MWRLNVEIMTMIDYPVEVPLLCVNKYRNIVDCGHQTCKNMVQRVMSGGRLT